MKTIVNVFEKDGQSVWSKENGETTTYSKALEVVDTTLDLKTLFTREEKFLVWMKANSEDTVNAIVDYAKKELVKGALKACRIFSKTPFYDGQSEDINPESQVSLGRYSQVQLCTADEFHAKHRQFIVATDVVAEPVVAEDAPKFNAGV
jgi:hypothetical protein